MKARGVVHHSLFFALPKTTKKILEGKKND